ncbi:MAG: metal ABC transporter permease [Pseudomonadota bacterium]
MLDLDDFLVRAALAGIGLALITGPLGAFIVWRRMAYFGDATAHAALLGVALALALSGPIFAGVLVVSLAMALAVSGLAERGLGTDSLLGVMAHGALAFGLVSVSLIPGARSDLSAYLFGDILAVTRGDLAIIWAGAAVALVLLIWRWQGLLAVTLNPDLAHAAGLNPAREQMVLTLAFALVVAVAIKVVGALLIVSLLIIPASSARPLARSPEVMAAVAAVLGMAATLLGLGASLLLDTPTGASIVCAATIIFMLSHGVQAVRVR